MQQHPPQGGAPPPQGGAPPPHGGPPPQGGGYPPSGYPPSGYPPQGYPPQGYPPQGYPPQGGPPPSHGAPPPQGGAPPHGGAPPPQGGAPPHGGPPPQGGAPPPQGGGYPPSGYPPQGGGYPPSGYPPQGGGYPPQGYPPQGGGGYPPQGGYPPSGYPPQGGAPPPQGGPPKWSPAGASGAPPPPATSFNNSWFGTLYQQINQNEMLDIQRWFASVDADRSGTVTANELAGITFNGAPLGFVVAQKLLNVFDKDRSGNISFHEYAALHKFLTNLQNAWFSADRDRSGRLDANEIQTALGMAGFQLSVPTVRSLMFNYDKSGWGLTFGDFLMVCATAAQVKTAFEVKDSSKSGTLHLNYEQAVEFASLIQ